jgi:oligopeptide/dipeptide ABC transporter ATP-binding protein
VSDLLRVRSLVKHFRIGKGLMLAAVNDVSFNIAAGQTLGLVGESGSGKTTVGRCILRLIRPTSGEVWFHDQDLARLPEARLRQLRGRAQLVFQDPSSSLNPQHSVRWTINEPLDLLRIPATQRRDRIDETLSAVGLSASHLPRYPAQLTASEQQRVAIARAIVSRPELVVLDEPTSTLDASARKEILTLFVDLQKRFDIAYLLISHDLTAVRNISDRIAVMYLGRIIETGSTLQITQKQFHPYSRALLSAVLYPDPRERMEPFVLRGEIPSPINPRDECSLLGRCPIGTDICATAFPPLEEVEPGHFAACYRWREFTDAAKGEAA